MREILFRAKRLDNGEWVEGSPISVKETGQCYMEFADTIHGEITGIYFTRYEVDPSTLCQYTGLTDKNCQKIWENDIVGFWDTYSTENGQAETDCVGEVLWSDEELLFYVTNRISAESYEVLDDCVVIGNIFDNTELLEGGAE